LFRSGDLQIAMAVRSTADALAARLRRAMAI
jgi:hypothetical protein